MNNYIESFKEHNMHAPANYPVCLNMKCDKRTRCLHALKTTDSHLASLVVTCVNPLIYKKVEPCVEFRDKDATAIYAFGMTTLAEQLKLQNLYRHFMLECLKHYCRTVYYEMYCGQRVILPSDQDVILSCAHSVGANLHPDCFDRMVIGKVW